MLICPLLVEESARALVAAGLLSAVEAELRAAPVAGLWSQKSFSGTWAWVVVPEKLCYWPNHGLLLC